MDGDLSSELTSWNIQALDLWSQKCGVEATIAALSKALENVIA